jgi:tRNA pseudouridine38-40 synthase
MNEISYMIEITYDGFFINGWEGDTNNIDSIFISTELKKILKKITKEDIKITCAGRTDAGVHAISQFCSFQLSTNIDPSRIQKALNFYLPSFIKVKNVFYSNLNARFDAKQRTYKYYIYEHGFTPPLLLHRCLSLKRKLDLNSIEENLHLFQGTNDFSIFYPTKYDGKRIRTIESCMILQETIFNFPVLCVTISAKSFAHHQVRNMIGCIIEIGLNKWKDFEKRLNSRNRSLGGRTASPSGLYLFHVKY